jgi:uncharacterized membrane protein
MEDAIMSLKWYRLITAAIATGLGAIIGWAILAGNTIVPIPAAIVAVVLLYLLRRKVNDVVADERNYKIDGKASSLTIKVSTLVIALIGVVLTAASTDHPQLKDVGFTLSYCACGLLILYIALYAYYSRKG